MHTFPGIRPSAIRFTTAVMGLFALLALSVVAPAPASAHARLEATSPKDGSTLTATPPEVMLRFNEPVQGDLSEVSVTKGSTDVARGELEIDGDTVYQGIKSTLDKGTYTVTYKVVSADGHPVSGSFSFTYAPPGEDEQEGEARPTSSGDTTSGETSPGSQSPSTGSANPSPTTPLSTSDSSTSDGSAAADGSESTSSDGDVTSEDSPSESPSSSPTETAAAEDGQSGSDGVPGWVWAAGAGAIVLVVGGGVLAARGGRSASEEENATDDEWRG